MPFSVYDIVVPTAVHGLNVLDGYLDWAEQWESTADLAVGTVLATRLAPDMLTFGEQFTVTCDKLERNLAKLRQVALPMQPSVPMTYGDLRQRLIATRTMLERLDPAELANAQSHTYDLRPPIVQGWFGGDDYIRHLVLPDFFFHIAMVHAILRHLGAPVGKRDYLGHLAVQSGGYS